MKTGLLTCTGVVLNPSIVTSAGAAVPEVGAFSSKHSGVVQFLLGDGIGAADLANDRYSTCSAVFASETTVSRSASFDRRQVETDINSKSHQPGEPSTS